MLTHESSKPLLGEAAYLQAALLYTSPEGERCIRVVTRQLPIVDELRALAASVNPPAAIALAAKAAVAACARKPTKDAIDNLNAKLTESVVAQRSLCPPPLQKTTDEIILLRALSLLPLLTYSLARLPALNPLQPQALSPDAAAVQLDVVRRAPPELLTTLLMPRLFVLHRRTLGDGFAEAAPAHAPPAKTSDATSQSDGAEGDATEKRPPPVEVLMPSRTEVFPDGVYLLDTMQELILWVGQQSAPSFLVSIFGSATPADGAPVLPDGANPASSRLHAMIGQLRAKRPHYAPLVVVVQGSSQQADFFGRLVVDGYDMFMLHLASKVAQKL